MDVGINMLGGRGKGGREGADPVTEGNDLEHGYKEGTEVT